MRSVAVLALAGFLSACQTAPVGATPTHEAMLPVPDAIDALGTEPFWAVMIDAEQIALTRPDHPPVTAPNVGASRTGSAARWEAKTAEGVLKLTVTAGPCSDGMSDRSYPFKAEASIGGRKLKGCAAAAGERGEN
jgi:uncharacterized membrane protein